MRKPGVLLIVENLPAPFDRRVWLEACTLRDAGYRVSIICPMTKELPKRKELLDGVAIYRHPAPVEASGAAGYLVEYTSALFWEICLTLRVAFERGFDVIHACNPPDLIFLVASPWKLLGKKFIFDHHDLCPELFEAKFHRRGVFYRMLRLFERLTFWAADVSIATNASYLAVALERGRMRPENAFIVRSGPKQREWTPGPGAQSWRNGRRHLVGYVGVMGEQEGLDLLIEAVRIIVKDLGRNDVQFVLIGDGTERGKLEARVAHEGLQEFIRFTGRISDATMIEALSSADVLVNPDRPSELNDKSTMNKIVEYMALGKPIVQFDMKEGRFSAQEASLYVRAGDLKGFAGAILRLLDDPQARARMGAAGRARFESVLSWERQRPVLLAAYARALADVGAKTPRELAAAAE